MEDAKDYLRRRHRLSDQLIDNIHWPSLKFTLQKFSARRRATAVKALHRHLPTQGKLFSQGRVTMTSHCLRCLHTEETNADIYCCPNANAVKHR